MSPTGGDTIVARATARGIAAIAMVRVSGPDAVQITSRHFRGADLRKAPERTAHVGWIRSSGYEDVDQVVATVFRAPHTVTGEDLVEITCHGGDFVTQRVVEAIVAGGARPAGPGEFTQRAYLNGRIDLAQAEAVAELIHAGSRRAQRISVAHLKGSYSARLSELRNELLDVCALVELELDFSDEDVAFADRARLEEMLARGEALIDQLVRSYRYGLVVRDGISVVIGGRPNAGKSTLLNGLVGYDRAIVSETPGTTRDEIGEETEFDGLRVRFLDTAGLRETIDEIEAEGVRRAEASIRKADVLLYVYDVLVGLEAEEIRFLSDLGSSHPDLTVLLVCNKCDRLQGGVPEACGEPEEGRYGTGEAFFISARQAMDDEGIVSPILEAIVRTTRSDEAFDEETDVVTNERHHDHLRRAGVALAAARARLTEGASGDVLALELRTAMNELGAITGATANEDVLDRIFSRFCIGK